MTLFSLTFWKKTWKWCKVNWKFLVGFAIPCIVLYFLNQKKAKKILEAGLDFRKEQLSVAQKASDLESDGIKRNAGEFADRVEEVTTIHEEALRKLANDGQTRRNELGGSDATHVTSELANRFDLNNKDK